MSEKEVKGYLATVQPELKKFAIRDYGEKEFMRSAILAISDNAELAKCISTPAGKTSLYNALKYAATTGLSLNPMEGKAALIGYGGKVQYQIMKNGMIELAMQSGKVEFITSDTVRENDIFTIQKTMNGDEYSFIPDRKNRGEIDGFFAAVKLTNGAIHVKYMTKIEVEDHRNKYSSSYKSQKDKSPWSKSFEGMGLKTVLKALFRGLNIAPEIDAAVGADDKAEYSEPLDITPKKGVSSSDITEKLEQKKKQTEPPVIKAEPTPKTDDGSLF